MNLLRHYLERFNSSLLLYQPEETVNLERCDTVKYHAAKLRICFRVFLSKVFSVCKSITIYSTHPPNYVCTAAAVRSSLIYF